MRSLIFLPAETKAIIIAVINWKRGALIPYMCLQKTSEDNLLILLLFLLSARLNPFLDKRRWKSSPSQGVWCKSAKADQKHKSRKGECRQCPCFAVTVPWTSPVHQGDPSHEHKATRSWAGGSWGARASPAAGAPTSFLATTGSVLFLCPARCC